MVFFELVFEDDLCATYRYYPECRKAYGYGVITLLKKERDIVVTELAPGDVVSEVTVEDLLALRNDANRYRREEGEPELTEEEWPVPEEGYIKVYYADHARRRIMEAFDQGEVLKSGKVVWY